MAIAVDKKLYAGLQFLILMLRQGLQTLHVVVEMAIARLLFYHDAATRVADSPVVVEMVIAAGGILIFVIAKPTIQKSHGSNTHNIGKTNICT